MNNEEYRAIASEIKELESILAEIPKENVIERMGFESRLASARATIDGVTEQQLTHKAKLTFKGRPVVSSHGVEADFASKATEFFTDAIAAVVAGVDDALRYMGRIPGKQNNQLLITGTVMGSFGFEFELPNTEEGMLIPGLSKVEDAMESIQELFRLSASGSDDDVTDLVSKIHPRAVKKAAEFLNYLAQQDASCGLEFKERFFRFNDTSQVRSSAIRLREDNIHEKDEECIGEFQGVLPRSRDFEFKVSDNGIILKGKVAPEIEDADILNRQYLHKSVKVRLHVIQFGQGRPRYSLTSIENIIINDETEKMFDDNI